MDLLRLGSTTLLNVQQALATTGNNISNANTDGYSRQRVNFVSRESATTGFGAVGQGALIGSIDRASDNFLTKQVQAFSASNSRYSTYLDYSTRLNDLMADVNNNLNSSVQAFFNSVQGVSANPSGLPERQVMLSSAGDMVQRLQTMNSRMSSVGQEIDTHIKTAVDEINGLSESIRQLNMQIVSGSASNTVAAPNDLLDRRDQLLKELSTKVGITVLPQGDGSLNVFAGKGQALVVGALANKLTTVPNPNDGTKLEIAFVNSGGTPVSQFLEGGSLQGLLEFRDRNMSQAESRLGLLALTLSSQFNAQHQKGMDLLSNIGGDFFSTANMNIASSANNTGTTALTVSITDVTNIKASDYGVRYDGTTWHLTRMSDDTEVTGTGVLNLDGMSVDTSAGVPATGDNFHFNPAREAAGSFQLLVKDPRLIAAAAAVKNVAAAGNIGKAALNNLQVTDATKLPMAAPLSVVFDPDALGAGLPGFVLSGAFSGTLAYDPVTDVAGKNFALATLGISFRINGVPQNGDAFTVSPNNGAKSDNRNALALTDLQSSKIVNGKQDTLQSFYGSLVADVGINQQQAESNKAVQSSMLQQAEQYRDSVSGVNLDEEAANMLRFQQAYQAAAQMIKISDQIFQTLIQSIG